MGSDVLTSTQAVVAAIWARNLSTCTSLTPESDFFELGGDSILMLNMLFHIKQVLGIQLLPGSLFENPSLQAFSLVVTLARESAELGTVGPGEIEMCAGYV